MEITQPLHRAAQLAPDQPATVTASRTRTNAESIERVARLAGALRALDVSDGDRVAIVSLNSDRFHEALLAVPWAGAVVVPVNFRWSAAEIAMSFEECGVAIVFVDDAFQDLVESVREVYAGVLAVVYLGDSEAPPGTYAAEELIAHSTPVEDARRGGSDPFGIFYTGGTTGMPKGVMLTHENMMTSAYGAVATGEFMTPGGRFLHVAPMFHLADLCAWMGALILGSTHVFVPSFTPASVLSAIREHAVTDTLLVPTMIQMLVDAPERPRTLESVAHLIYGASPITESLLTRARAFLPNATFLQAYGMTELSPIATLLLSGDHDDPALRRSVGRAAPHVEVRVVDDDDREVPRGEVGEVVVRGGALMAGYWQRPDETAEALRGGWMHTGDGGYMDDRGYLYVVDRIKDMIITGGENVYSIEVENVIAKHPAVAAVAVIGLPDDQWGERVHAVIMAAAGATVTLEELQVLARSEIAGYKVPRSISFVDALPISAAGKVLKRELRAQH